MAFVNIKVTGTAKLNRVLQRMGAKAPKVLGSALFQEGESIISESKEKFVPVVTNALRSSGFVELPKTRGRGGVFVEAGFGGPAGKGNVKRGSNSKKVGYALVVHENQRAGKTGGTSPKGKSYKKWSRVGQWKYLEKPFNRAKSGMDKRLAARVIEAEPRFR